MKKWIRVLCLVLLLTLLCGSASAVSLKKGSQGQDVVFLLYRLQKLGYEGLEPTKYSYDNATVEAVKKFHQSRGLKVTGKVNDETWEEIFIEPYRLGTGTGDASSRNYYVRAGLVPPFTEVEVVDNQYGPDYRADLKADGYLCTVMIRTDKTLDQSVESIQDELRKAFDDTFVPQYDGKNYKVSGNKTYKINGKQARICTVTWNFANTGKSTRYSYIGAVELDKVDGVQVIATVQMHYNIP